MIKLCQQILWDQLISPCMHYLRPYKTQLSRIKNAQLKKYRFAETDFFSFILIILLHAHDQYVCNESGKYQGPVVQSVVSLTSSLRVIHFVNSFSGFKLQFSNIFCWKNEYCKSYSHFFSKKNQNICVSLDININKSLTNDIVSFEQLGPDCFSEFLGS